MSNSYLPMNKNNHAEMSKGTKLTQLSLRSYLTCRSKRSSIKSE